MLAKKTRLLNSDSLRWKDVPSEARIRQYIQAQLDLVLPSVYGYCLVSLGHMADEFTFEKASVVNVVRLNAEYDNSAYCECTSLPLSNDDIDAIFLPFQLELCKEPHSLLREAYRALRPGGKLIITTFNPISVWGFRRLFRRFDKNPLWNLPSFRHGRVLEWLSVLDYTVTVSHRLFNPAKLALGKRLMNYSDSAQYSSFGVVNVVVAEKRAVPLTPSKPWQRLKSIHPVGIESMQRTYPVNNLNLRNNRSGKNN